MNRFLRRGVLGATAVGVAGFPFLLNAATTGYDFAVAIVCGIAYAVSVPPAHGQENNLSTNRPDTLTQTSFIQNFSLAVGRRTIHLRNYEFTKHAFGADDIVTGQSVTA